METKVVVATTWLSVGIAYMLLQLLQLTRYLTTLATSATPSTSATLLLSDGIPLENTKCHRIIVT